MVNVDKIIIINKPMILNPRNLFRRLRMTEFVINLIGRFNIYIWANNKNCPRQRTVYNQQVCTNL